MTAVTFILQTSCTKDLKNATNSSKPIYEPGVVFNFGGKTINATKGDAKQTILGNIKENPYTIANMNIAYHNVYDSTANLSANRLYVKFTPQSYTELIKLSDNEIFLQDFPFEYEVITMGDYYQQIKNGEYPTLYAAVNMDFDLTAYNHQIIDNLFITDDPFLIIEAYTLVGRYNEVSNIEIPIDDIELPTSVPEPPTNGCEAPCHWVLYNQNPNEYPISWAYRCKCPPPPPVDACQSTYNAKKPWGQIKVDDTQLSVAGDPTTFEGVRQIKVIIRSIINPFGNYFVMTNNNGCWLSNDRVWGSAWIYVRLSSPVCFVRGSKQGGQVLTYPASYSTGITHYVGKVNNNQLNNIQINYNRSTNFTSNDYLYWSGATVNNAIHEFIDYAQQELINMPPLLLNVFVNTSFGGGAAPMFGQMTTNDIDFWVQHLTATPTWFNSNIGNKWYDNIIEDSYLNMIAAVKALGPDILIGAHTLNSDILKNTVYHETAHASHSTNAGIPFWLNVTIAESNAFFATGDAHGNAAFANADIIAVAESWAEHVALTFAHFKYPTDPVTSINTTYNIRLEQTWNESPNHIPIGLYHDLIDSGTEPTSWNADWSNSTTVVDNVSGFTNQQIFSCLNANTVSINNFQTQLINTQMANTSNTLTNVNLLFSSY